LQEQLILGVAPNRAIQELDLAAPALEFFQQDHQLDVVARQAVGIGDQHVPDVAGAHRVAQSVQAGPVQRRPAVTIIPEDPLACEFLTASPQVSPQAFELLLDGLGLRLTQG